MKEFPRWLARTSEVIKGPDQKRVARIEEPLSEQRKKDILKAEIKLLVSVWDRLKIDGAIEELAPVIGGETGEAWLWGTTQKIRPTKNLYDRVVSSPSFSLKNTRAVDLENLSIVKAVNRSNNGWIKNLLRVNLESDEIYLTSSRKDPRSSIKNSFVEVKEDLGNPHLIKTPEAFRDKLDVFVARLARDFPDFLPK